MKKIFYALIYFMSCCISNIALAEAVNPIVPKCAHPISNPDIREAVIKECDETEIGEKCVLYIMNNTSEEKRGEDFFEDAAQAIGLAKEIIEKANMRYGMIFIPPKYCAQIRVPQIVFQKEQEVTLSKNPIQEVVANPAVNPQLKRCGTVDPSSSCVFYVMNNYTYNKLAQDFFEQAVSKTMRSLQSIQRVNRTYANFIIPPGYFAEIKIPSNHDFSTLKLIEDAELRHFIEDYLKSRYSVVSDLDSMRKTWGKDGPVYEFSTSEIYKHFVDFESKPLLSLAREEQFTRKVMIEEMEYDEEDNAYIAKMRFDDKSSTQEQTTFWLVYLSLCDNKVCNLGLKQVKRPQ